ncbi:Protein of unknown function (DUF3305) [Beggiatoa alba B18LD]|uniref:DUF3305 domain-containing protein n=1 Tax=Beggiatoa alba B18LD TaxID=395493 RepID=I3CBG4_9GAMM|nr:DUF3305 domain-containing protein [Beggiatoa alba]EIJ40957.1 Protein of unknown function (DUF3305) [Beggiatoa alba B18LD]
MMSLGNDFPTLFRVSVLTACERVEGHTWLKERWRILGVVPVHEEQATSRTELLVTDQETQYLWTGFTLQLHKDELESYYHNLTAPKPRLYVVCHGDANEEPIPFLVTLSYDESAAYGEAESRVYDVSMPAEIYRWMELYVLEYYNPKPREKRERQKWFNDKSSPS